MAARKPYAVFHGDRLDFIADPGFDADQIDDHGAFFHARDVTFQKSQSRFGEKHWDQDIAGGDDLVVRDSVDGAFRQCGLRNGSGPVPTVHFISRMFFQRFRHRASD